MESKKVMKRRDADEKYCCSSCKKEFAFKYNLERHRKLCKLSSEPLIHCPTCDVKVWDLHTHQRSAAHKNKLCEQHQENVEVLKTSYKTRIASYRVRSHSKKEFVIPEDFLKDVKECVIKLVKSKMTSAIKINMELFGDFVKPIVGAEEDQSKMVKDTKSFNTKNKVIYPADNLEEVFNSFVCEMSTQASEFQERDSGWAVEQILYLEVNINKFNPLKGSSFLPLPKWIQRKRACVNVKNYDNTCFFWAVVAALHPASTNSERIKSYPHYDSILKTDGVKVPVTIRDIKKFEILNDISINVYEVSGQVIAGPVYHTKKRCDTHINLLLIEDGKRAHYVWIKNLSRLVGSQISSDGHQTFICDGCLLTFTSEQKYREHSKHDCSLVTTSVPAEGDNILEFKNFCNKLQVPVIVYADFEAILKPISTCSPDKTSSFTVDYQIHEAHSFGYYIKCTYDDTLSKYVCYRGGECAKSFIRSLQTELAPFAAAMKTVVPMNALTSSQEWEYATASNCHICGGELGGEDRVRDHCHLTGAFRGAAHNDCNLNFKIKNNIPIVLHNLSKYDSHFIVKVLHGYNVNLIPKNKENFISFTITNSEIDVNLRFIDSCRFMACSLEKLVENLVPEQFKILRKHFPDINAFKLVSRKGIFPYEYVDSMDRLNETLLPPQKCFYSTLNKCAITESEYNHAQNVWKTFNIKNIGEYSDLYLKTDVLLLADVFENFREVCFKTYELDPAHYFTAPGLSWDAMLKFTRVKMELFTDISMIKFVMSGIRGGMSQCCGKYSRANNKYMADYNPTEESRYITYLDANNLYGWALSQPLPISDFRWLEEAEIENFKLNRVDSEKGYILEVDVDYPDALHHLHNDFPFCFELLTPESSKSKTKKLIGSLHDKKEYVIHYVNLKQALRHGLVLKKIHRILEFTQSPWLQGYIQLNTDKRTVAANAFEKDFYKLMNNAVFGKTMENVDKRVDVKLANSWESKGKRLGARALISKLNFHSSTVVDEDLTIIQMNRNKVKYDKPIYIGFSVLELSKTLMYEFHYDYIIPKYNNNVRLLYTDTDSFIYEVRTDDFYNDIRPDLEARFDTSDFPPNNIYRFPLINKKVIGMMKDECSGGVITEFIGIRSKCYCIITENGRNTKKIKGIKRKVVADEIMEQDYLDCLNHNRILLKEMNVIRSRVHNVYTQTINKIALKNYDDKRFCIPDDRHKTLAWGHKDVEKYYFI